MDTPLNALRDLDPGEYRFAQPFPHAILPGFLSLATSTMIVDDWPADDWVHWHHHTHNHSNKLACGDRGVLPARALFALDVLNGQEYVAELRRVLREPELTADVELTGGGLHMLAQGGYLGRHVDFNLHPDGERERVANLLVYLSHCEGGELELGNPPTVRVSPAPGLAVLFTTDEAAWHGNPSPVRRGRRLSLALYFYRPRRVAGPGAGHGHSTIYG